MPDKPRSIFLGKKITHPQGATRDEPPPLIYKTVSMTGVGKVTKNKTPLTRF